LSFIAVDIGATNIRVAVGPEKGIKSILKEQTDQNNGPIGISSQIIKMIDKLKGTPKAIGIGSIGPIDIKKGIITNTPNYPFNNIPILKPIKEKYDIPVLIANDCTAAVLGEKVFGAGKSHENLFYVTLSTGLGGGAIVDGHLLFGKDGNAPEIGHISIYSDIKLVCGCGGLGHWEAYSSGANIPNYAKKILENHDWENSKLFQLCEGNLEEITAIMIFDLAKKGDAISKLIVNEIGKVNSSGFANIVNAFDPELITVGGSIALNNPDLVLTPIKKRIDSYLINRKPKIMITPLGADIVLFGALALAIQANIK
jgi:glucokinase